MSTDLVPFNGEELRALQQEALVEIKSTLTKELQERRINPLFIPIVNAYLGNEAIPEIAIATGLNVFEVSLILDKPEIKNYINQMVLSYGYLNKLKRVELITKVIDKIIADADEYDTPMTKKDLLDWLKLLQGEVALAFQGAPKTAVQVNTKIENNMLNLMQELMVES
jgi:hypothetical protein